jgi:hypothetical protein
MMARQDHQHGLAAEISLQVGSSGHFRFDMISQFFGKIRFFAFAAIRQRHLHLPA